MQNIEKPFKVGQKVRIKKNAEELTRPKYGWDSSMTDMLGHVYEIDEVGFDSLRILNNDKSAMWAFTFDSVESVEKTWDDLAKSDIVIDEYDDEYTILIRIDDCVLVSDPYKHTNADNWYTIHELQDEGYTIKQPIQEEKIEELTLDQVCKELGRTVKIVK